MKIVSGFPGTKSWEESLREREHREIARRVGAEGIVLLENDGTLPLSPGSPIALYGVGARHTIMGGTGSGKVNCRPGVTIEEGLNGAGFVITNKAWL
ncbi:MAG: beta-glucosidase, partial [Blautia sp.]|nr:beta-glucosidase [Blautia sp.]